MKIGTFKCWLFGHKFLIKSRNSKEDTRTTKAFINIQTDFCIYCGIDKEHNPPIIK